MDGYDAPEVKPWQNRIHPLWLPTASQEDITGTTQYQRWSYCSKRSGEKPRWIYWPTPKLQETHKEKTKKAMANIIKIHAIWKYVTVQSCTTLILMLCITHLDYANAMLCGLPSSTLRKYQTIQNTCAKLVLNKNRYSSLSWALKKLHWLFNKGRTQNPDDNI